MGEAVIDLYEIEVSGLDVSHRHCLWSRKSQPNLEKLPAPGNVVGRQRMAFGGTGDVNRALAQTGCALCLTEDHLAGAGRLEAIVEEPELNGKHPCSAIII